MTSAKKVVTIKVDEETKLSQIAKAFAAQFPYLSLRFFKHAHVPRLVANINDVLDMNSAMHELAPNFRKSQLSFHEQLSVAELEILIKDQLGLNAQVYRKHHENWQQTWATDMWTVAEQNRRGELINKI